MSSCLRASSWKSPLLQHFCALFGSKGRIHQGQQALALRDRLHARNKHLLALSREFGLQHRPEHHAASAAKDSAER
jgi:hypothetical protein